MAEYAEVIGQEFALWKENLEESVQQLEKQLSKPSADDPANKEDLENKLTDTRIDLEQVEKYRPTSSRKTTPYPYADAIKPIAAARKAIAQAERRLGKLEASTSKPNPQSSSSSTRRNIPEVKITPFAGDVVAYKSFIAAFKMKFDPLDISDGEKLQQLKEHVEGNPKRAIQPLDLTDENYAVALRDLEKNYDKPDDVIEALYSKLESLPQSSNTNADLKATYFEIEGILAALESHGHSLDSFPPLKKKVYKKYPPWLANQGCKNGLLPVKNFQEEVAKALSIRSSLHSGDLIQAEKRHSTFHANSQRENQPRKNDKKTTGPAPKPGEKKTGESQLPTCVFCSELHYSNECKKYTSLEDRRALIRDRCLLCFNKGHKISDCRKTSTCYHCKKQNSHHQALCPTKYGKPNEPQTTQEEKEEPPKDAKLVGFIKNHVGAHTTAMVTVVNPLTAQRFGARVLFDNGSSETYIAERAAQRFGLALEKFRTTPVTVFGVNEPVRVRSATTAFQITNGKNFSIDVVGDTIPQIPQDVRLFDYDEFRRAYPQHAETPLLEQGRANQIDILLGGDYYFDIVEPSSKKVVDTGLFLLSTAFGNMLVGRTSTNRAPETKKSYFTMTPTQAVNKLTSLEAIGISTPPLNAIQEEEIALKQFYDNLTFINGRYQIRWPWREFPPPLQNNFPLAMAVLKNQQRKLDAEMFKAYNEIIDKQIANGIVEEITVKNPLEPNCYYLPHHAVITPEKSTPLRIVYNGAAKSTNAKYAINDLIYKGLNLLTDSTGIIIRSRFAEILQTSDLEKAFHQLSISTEDANYVRFLWLFDWRKPPTGSNLRYLRFLRVAFGIDASPFLLYATLRFHLERCKNKQNKHIIEKILRDIFADNINTGFEDEDEAYEFYKIAVEIFDRCSMNLRAWASNSESLREKYQQANRSEKISILGICWNQYKDTYSINAIKPTEKMNLRNVLSVVSSFFDPCGWNTPITTNAKIFLRSLHDSNYDWDDSLTEADIVRWREIEFSIIEASKITFQRFQFNLYDKNAKYQLHAFADASEKAYASVLYIRKTTENESKIAIVIAKSRITPRTPKLTTPKLELIAAVLAAKLIEFARKELPIMFTDTILWSDSKCVLNWLTRNRLLPVFVQRRINTIKATPNVEYQYVPSGMNPADLPSRGGNVADLEEFQKGPNWLHESHNWPPAWSPSTEIDFEPEEEKINTKSPTIVATITHTVPKYPFEIDPKDYSSYLRMLRVTALAMTFVARFTRSRERKIFEDCSLFAAQRLWIDYEQLNHYYDVITALEQKKKHELVNKLNLYLDSPKLIRCAGRLENAPLSPNEKSPILLPPPKSSPFVRLLVEFFHASIFHAGTSRTLHTLRKKYWITSGQRAVHNVLRSCTKCKRFTAKPYKQPEKSNLPEFRMTEENPFKHIGIDTFGPIWIQNIKYFVLIVADLVIRAVDLELLQNMTTDEIYLAFRTVVARRTKPVMILSDNAPQFHLIEQQLKATYTHEWSWKFLPAFSPWMGGAYERLVGLVKQSLSRTFYGTVTTESGIRTALGEIANAINDRPLTYVSEEKENCPLTPNDFLKTKFQINQDVIEDTIEVTPEMLRHFAKQAIEIHNKFWKAWRSPYLQYLRTMYTRYKFPRKVTYFIPEIGEIILIAAELQKREKWKLGKIVKLYESSDGICRSAAIKTKNGVIVRPLKELYPLELRAASQEPEDDWDNPEITVEIVDNQDE